MRELVRNDAIQTERAVNIDPLRESLLQSEAHAGVDQLEKNHGHTIAAAI